LKSLDFLIYENDIAAFGGAMALATIDNITGRGKVEIRVSIDSFFEYCALFSASPVDKRVIYDRYFQNDSFYNSAIL